VLADFPIELCCAHRSEQLQLEFARKAIEILPKDSSTTFAPEPRGLVIAAETEMALERPVRRLADVYGDMVRIGPPTVRYRHEGERIEQPIMGLRVLCPPECYEPIREDLRLRRAAIMDAEVNRRFGIVRANAPLAALIGYPDRMAALTRGRGQLVMWLSHYEELEDPPPAGVAA
jgi:predicted membrane GTPase involved in stress response